MLGEKAMLIIQTNFIKIAVKDEKNVKMMKKTADVVIAVATAV